MAHNRVTYVSRALRLIQPPPPPPPRDRHGRPVSLVGAEAKIRIKVCPSLRDNASVSSSFRAAISKGGGCNGTSALYSAPLRSARIRYARQTTSGVPPGDLMEDSAVVSLFGAASYIRGDDWNRDYFPSVLRIDGYNTYISRLLFVKTSLEINSTIRCECVNLRGYVSQREIPFLTFTMFNVHLVISI